MKELQLTITHIKILDTISNLNKQGMYPLSDGVYKIVAGVVDEETANLREEPTFGTLISFNSKKVCRYLLALQRYGYIKKIYNKSNTNKQLPINKIRIIRQIKWSSVNNIKSVVE